MTDLELSVDQLLRHRLGAHQLSGTDGGSTASSVLGVGVRDNPVGVTASLALRARGLAAPSGGTVRAYSVRAAVHVHRTADFGLLRAALRWLEGDEPSEQTYGPVLATLADAGLTLGSTVDEVAAAMREVMSDAAPRTKGELSTAVTERVRPEAAPWCEGCGAHHVDDGLFRHATLVAGIIVVPGSGRSFQLQAVDTDNSQPDPDSARAALLTRYVHLAGVATPAQFATWSGLSRPAVRRWWALIADRLTTVRVDGARYSALADDVDSLVDPPSAQASSIHLLPAYDPYTELADRKLLAPDADHRRRIWRAVRNPGVVLRGGEIVGVWRDRSAGAGRAVTIEPFRPLTGHERRAAAASAERLFDPTPVSVTYE